MRSRRIAQLKAIKQAHRKNSLTSTPGLTGAQQFHLIFWWRQM
ncbi:hypothetical protein AA98_1587 [Escherichia coli 2-011-08_S1_C1]|nr:hypothetical protein ECSTEC7V_1593 [Escherichia coli STEC_7v]KDA58526.1 hypothetical protein AA98_1587 [Escherichia coli 2-011-08_S1_C1]